jgi:class 3 adenylate cyclase
MSQVASENLLAQFRRYIPGNLAEQILATKGNIEGERKCVTVVFADVSGFTAMSEKMDAEEVTEIINQLFTRLVDIIYRYEGTVDKFIGDCVMALFGAPIAHENDAERALLASMDMLNAVEEMNQTLPVRLGIKIGLNIGTVVVGNIGSDLRMEYTAMGDVVNLAKRLQESAISGQILLSESVYNATRGAFDFRTLKPVKVKGKNRSGSRRHA